jgi:adenosylcobinamide kinase/adenosylcobinamide-phosphate guanylyltransferase
LSCIIFITGGARSGKSNLAVQIAENAKGGVAFIATAQSGDEEMKERIRLHKESRPEDWTTIEEPLNIASAIAEVKGHKVIIIDCLTLLLSNLMFENNGSNSEDEIMNKIRDMIQAARDFDGTTIVVSNEVGMGIVPENELARRFRDLAGKANQIMAADADEVYICFAGIPIKLKG